MDADIEVVHGECDAWHELRFYDGPIRTLHKMRRARDGREGGKERSQC